MITDKQIATCMAGFDFEAAAVLFHQRKWAWRSIEGIPNQEEIIEHAYTLLLKVQQRFNGRMLSIESGRLRVTAYKEDGGPVVLKLECIAIKSAA